MNYPGTDAATRRILQALRSVVRELRLASVSCERQHGLSAAQLFVLQTLQDQPGMSLGEVAERTATDQSSVSVVVRKLQEKKLVQKGVSDEDGRRLEIRLTPAGRRLTEKTPPTIQGQFIQRIASLSLQERTALASLLERFALPGAEAPPMFFEEPPAPRKKGGQHG
jgi:MarR family transcriptional regulator, lower aerobic nicotinate degradation pathway regulator